MSCFKNALIFGDQNFSSGDHFTKESRQKATSEKLELEALQASVKTVGRVQITDHSPVLASTIFSFLLSTLK